MTKEEFNQLFEISEGCFVPFQSLHTFMKIVERLESAYNYTIQKTEEVFEYKFNGVTRKYLVSRPDKEIESAIEMLDSHAYKNTIELVEYDENREEFWNFRFNNLETQEKIEKRYRFAYEFYINEILNKHIGYSEHVGLKVHYDVELNYKNRFGYKPIWIRSAEVKTKLMYFDKNSNIKYLSPSKIKKAVIKYLNLP